MNVIEGQNELQCEIWDYNSISSNEFISAGRHSIIPATQKPGAYDAWVSLKDKKGRPGGELRIVLHFQSSGPAKQPAMAAPAPGVKYQPPGWNAAAAAGKMMAAPPPPQPQQYVPPPPAPLPQGVLHARSPPPPLAPPAPLTPSSPAQLSLSLPPCTSTRVRRSRSRACVESALRCVAPPPCLAASDGPAVRRQGGRRCATRLGGHTT